MAAFSERITEFISEPDVTKFKNGSSLSFDDGASMYAWFNNNRYKILLSDNCDENCLVVREQYRKYLFENSYYDKVKQFILERDLTKFKGHSKATFKDGSLMGRWYNINHIKIETSNNRVSFELNRQLQLLKSGTRRLELTEDVLGAIKYVDESLERLPRFKR